MSNNKTVDIICRIVVDATNENDIHDTAHEVGEAFLEKFPLGSYTTAVRDGVWYLFPVGDDTDDLVFNPYN